MTLWNYWLAFSISFMVVIVWLPCPGLFNPAELLEFWDSSSTSLTRDTTYFFLAGIGNFYFSRVPITEVSFACFPRFWAQEEAGIAATTF
jgi:hypothetical protein